ncbi:MAG: oligosaccharide flippase family protein [Chitinophagaceae bacterium]|nr:oligosaccharide flippase family protein [Chitinophagaceae bacterium]
MISKTGISTISVWLACDWRPNFSFNFSKINSFLRFGSGIAAFDLINYFSRNLDNVLIGKYTGPVALGLYSKAYQLLMLPITLLRNPLNSVALPALSSLQSDKEKFRSFYKRFVFTLSFFSMPLVIYLAVFSEELILLLLGEKWTSASYVFKLLAISSFIQPVETTRGLIMTSTGKTKRHFYWGIINAVFVITGFLIGIKWGMEGIAISYVIVNYLILLPSLKYGFKGTPITVSLFFNEIFFSVTFSILAGVAMLLFRYYFISLPPFVLFSLGFVVGFCVYLALWQLNKVTRNKLQHITELLRITLNKYNKKI